MQLDHKIKKLLSGQGLASARKHTLRSLRANGFPLDKKRVIETIDPVAFDQIRQRYAGSNSTEDWRKYLDLDRWITINIRRIRDIELDLTRRKRILDLGCGAGYFSTCPIARAYRTWSVDLDRVPMFAETTVSAASSGGPTNPRLSSLHDLGGNSISHRLYDLLQRPQTTRSLGRGRVDFFLDDIAKHLATTRPVWLELNRGERRDPLHTGTKGVFQKRGAGSTSTK